MGIFKSLISGIFNGLLFKAVSIGRIDIAKLLIDKGADVNAKDENGDAPLQMAVCEGHADIVNLLHQHGAKK